MSAGKPVRLHEGAGFQKREAATALKNPTHKLWNRHSPDVYKVRFETTKGPFIIEVPRVWAPHGADRFYNLVSQGFFDDSRFFRVRAGYITQFGIPGDPVIASLWRNQAIPDDPVRQSNLRGVVGFAMTGPDTRTTQIYVNLVDNTRLDAEGFAPIGRVIEGMEIVDKLYAGYGEDAGGGMRRGKQGPIFEGGNKYLDQNYPKLDRLIRATTHPAHK
jgi:homoserine O-acetyltransferase